jgi:prepilin-type N-terminal cleavage/methylation domain-containing protein
MRRANGFTLIELAIVLAIVGLLLGMLIVPLNTQVDQQRINDTQKQLATITEAILGFAVANGRLPCPATPGTASTTAGAGLENKGVPTCNITEGVVPWATLGLPETDAWGRRFTYRVTGALADDPTGGLQASFALTDTGNITITSGGAAPVNVANNVAAVVVSHGKNGLGAYQQNGAQIAGAAGDELKNADADPGGIFVSKLPDPAFDDLVAWVSANVLKSRMVAANRLP